MAKKITTLENAVEEITTPVTTETVDEVKSSDIGATPRTIYIYRFGYDNGSLVIDYRLDDENGPNRHAKAHPALQVMPLMKKVITAEIVEDKENGFKILRPCPTVAQIEAYNAKQKAYEERKAQPKPEAKPLTKAQLAYLASF